MMRILLQRTRNICSWYLHRQPLLTCGEGEVVTPRFLGATLSFHACSTDLRQCNTTVYGLRGILNSASTIFS